MSNEQALADFHAAREHYLNRRFADARATMHRYGQSIDYRQFKQQDNRTETNPEISVVIVGYATGKELLECIQSVFAQQGQRFEIILVDNGQNEVIHYELAELPICWITPPINLLPSEGRNIGAHFACSDILVFLDDDAIMSSGYLASVQKRAQANEYLALRGRIQPKSPNAPPPPEHYNLGETEQPGEFNLEGNMVIRRSLFQNLGGFDPLMFGHDGKALTQQWRIRLPGKYIRYCPELTIFHDWAEAENLTKKRERQALGEEYLSYLNEHAFNAGASILIRAGDNLAAADNFLSSLVRYNTYKPIEVLLATTCAKNGLTLIKNYLGQIRIRISGATTSEISRVAITLRFEQVLIIDLPFVLEDDVIGGLIFARVRNQHIATVGRSDLQKLKGVALNASFSRFTGVPEVNAQKEDAGISNKPESQPENTYIARKITAPQTFSPSDFLVLSRAKSRALRAGARIIGGMATIPERQSTLQEVLSRLAPQFDELHVYLNRYEKKPSIGKLKNIALHLSDNYGDLGAKGKYFGLNFSKEDDYYFSLDDDFLYPNDYVQSLKNAISRYKDMVAVCVHGSIFGDPLDWYFERISTFSARQELKCDRFINLAGSGTFACKLSSFPIQFLDVMPRTMCDLQISIKANKLRVPLVSIKRNNNWLRTINGDSVSENGDDYWSKMLRNDEGRTEIAKKVSWDYASCKEYILDAMRKAQVPLDDHDQLVSDCFDVEFFDSVKSEGLPDTWDSEKSQVYWLRKYQYYASLLEGGRIGMSRDEILRSPNFKSLADLKALALECKRKWEHTKNDQ